MESEAPAKRARIDEGQAKAASASSGEDQITSSIEKIASHIGNLKKFTKAASLARQLLRSGQFERKYGKAFMKVLEAAMQDPSRVHDPLLRNDYRALFLAVEAEAESFSKPDRDQINVWSLRAVLTNELHTDDTYGFNKVLAKIKEQVEKLPVWVEFVPEVIPPPPPGPPPEPEEEEEEEDLDDIPMYFQKPQQLLDIFAQLEEQNLFLIQNCQETEEALEELKMKYRETKQRMDAETDGLQAQIDVLQSAIKIEEEKGKALMDRATRNTKGVLSGKDVSLDDLSSKVTEVYVRCGFEADASQSSLQMLTNIEAKLEEYLAIIDQMPEDFVEVAEKQKEKERRQRAREEKIEAQRREQERRVQRSLERAQAPVHKKQGKPLMFRSVPPTRKKKEDDTGPKQTDEEQELAAYLVREF
mmetsp:Transcript_12014/g.25254  ORF Transcript_12014/g.25254 Transcript_12014/m.25254 type:complete len:416 (-) Transcript_12014:229-1476(-)